jgi:FkbM family methyltransferase
VTVSATYCGDYTALVETSWGRYFYVDTRDTSVGSHLMHGKAWEAWITDMITPLIAGTTFIDLGANVGWFTVWALHHGAEGAILVEANRNLAELLEKTLAINGFFRDFPVQLYHRAISDTTDEEITLHIDNWFIAGASTVWGESDSRAPSNLKPYEGRFWKQTVKTVSIDSMKLDPTKRYFIKLDVEGAEESALEGARDLIEACQDLQLLIEYNGLSVRTGHYLAEQEFQLSVMQEDRTRRPVSPEDFPSLKQGDMIYAYRLQG